MTFTIRDTPSSSKGWARFRALVAGRSVLATASGTEWGSGRVGDSRSTVELEPGTVVVLEIHVQLVTGRSRRPVFSKELHRLVVTPGAECTVEFRPGSQGIRLAISGAEVAQ
jgi:hypothetical protein